MKNRSVIVFSAVNIKVIVLLLIEMYVLEVHFLLCGLFLTHGSPCLSNGPSTTTTFACALTQLTQLAQVWGKGTREQCLVYAFQQKKKQKKPAFKDMQLKCHNLKLIHLLNVVFNKVWGPNFFKNRLCLVYKLNTAYSMHHSPPFQNIF